MNQEPKWGETPPEWGEDTKRARRYRERYCDDWFEQYSEYKDNSDSDSDGDD